MNDWHVRVFTAALKTQGPPCQAKFAGTSSSKVQFKDSLNFAMALSNCMKEQGGHLKTKAPWEL